MNSSITIIAFKEFRDRLLSGWILVCVLVWFGAIGLTSCYGLVQIGRIGLQGYERTAISLLNLVQYLVPLLALLIGHDLVVREREDRTLHLILAGGVSRRRFLFGKFLGGCFTIALPLTLGFAIAGIMIGVAASDRALGPFLRLAASGLGLGVVFCGIGLLISCFCRTRVQALVFALLAWCGAVFVFDLAAVGIIVSTRAVKAAQEIEVVCDATHVNNLADIHSAFDAAPEANRQGDPKVSSASHAWVWLNPVDVFRVLNLPDALGVAKPVSAGTLSAFLWLAASLGLGMRRLRKMDL